MRRIVFLVFLFLGETWAAEYNTWRRAGDVRFVRSNAVIAVSSMMMIGCSATCTRVKSCLSFNYHSGDLQCELLSAVPPSLTSPEVVAESGWSFHFLDVPVPDPCYNSSCPITAMCIRYDQPVNLIPYDPSLYKHTCSDNTYFLYHRKAGRTDCHLKVHYNKEFYGYDTTYRGVVGPYHESLANCLDYSCVSMVCVGTTKCYLKYSSPEVHPEAFFSTSSINVWVPGCLEG